MKILVMGCDRYAEYTFEAFHHCIEKYWPSHPEVFYCTETVINPYYSTFTINYPVNRWSRRLNEALKLIDDPIVLVCPDDTFFRKEVKVDTIERLCSYIDSKLIAINLEPPFDCTPFNDILAIRNPKGNWLSSMMPQIWNRKKLIELTENTDLDPWQVERLGCRTPYSFGILATNTTDVDFGKRLGIFAYAIVHGRWAREMQDFAKKENLTINFNKLGFYN